MCCVVSYAAVLCPIPLQVFGTVMVTLPPSTSRTIAVKIEVVDGPTANSAKTVTFNAMVRHIGILLL
jgi:hypothetical protein